MTQKADPVVSEFKPKDRLKKLFHTYRSAINVAIVVILVALVAILALYLHNNSDNSLNSNTAFIINGKHYSKASIKALIAYPTSLGDSQSAATKNAFLIYKDQTAAAKLNINVPQATINAEKATLLTRLRIAPLTSSGQTWLNLVAYDDSLKNLVQTGLDATQAQGYVYIFWFNQHEDYPPSAVVPLTGNGNPNLIAQDRSYAETKATAYLSQLKAKTITPDKLIADINADPKLNADYLAGTNNSQQFGNSSTTNWAEEITIPAIINFIDMQESKGLSTIQVGTQTVPASVNKSGKVDAFFFITQLNSLPTKPISQSQFESTVEHLNTGYNGLG